jgi:hypothetical protein
VIILLHARAVTLSSSVMTRPRTISAIPPLPPAIAESDEWLRVKTAIARYGISKSTLYELMRVGNLHSVALRPRNGIKPIRLISRDSLVALVADAQGSHTAPYVVGKPNNPPSNITSQSKIPSTPPQHHDAPQQSFSNVPVSARDNTLKPATPTSKPKGTRKCGKIRAKARVSAA